MIFIKEFVRQMWKQKSNQGGSEFKMAPIASLIGTIDA